jgi:O-antigen ligase
MSSSDAWPLAWGLIGALGILALALVTRRTVSIGTLLIMIPFQTVDTRYGSSSVLLAYVLAAILVLTGDLKIRMLPAMGLIALAYFASLSLANREMLLFHLVFVFQLFSCFVVFILAYNFALSVENDRTAIDLLHLINALVVVYCLLQLTVGPGERFVPFGIEALQFNLNRHPGDPRLVGAFGNPGTTAGYFMLSTLICAFDFMFAHGRRRLLVAVLIGFNLLGLVATANRASFLVLLVMFMALMFLFRRELGARRIMGYIIGGTAALTVAAAIAVFYTDFGRMFERLDTVTETEGGIPATRKGGWPVAIEKIKKDPWFGEGPYFWTSEAAEKTGQARVEYDVTGETETAYDPYPHSLYLFLLRTVGAFGLITMLGFFVRTAFILLSASSSPGETSYGNGFVRLGLALIPAFLVSQITLEFIRPSTMDYAQFILALMGLLVGMADRSQSTVTATSGALDANRASAGFPAMTGR